MRSIPVGFPHSRVSRAIARDDANDWATEDVKKNLNAWKEANQDKLIN
jgi:hypothetical protein